jgi:hypothetical protein
MSDGYRLTDEERAALERIADRDHMESQPVARAILHLDTQ